MLMINSEERISIDDALRHRFIEKYFPQPTTILKVENVVTEEIEKN